MRNLRAILALYAWMRSGVPPSRRTIRRYFVRHYQAGTSAVGTSPWAGVADARFGCGLEEVERRRACAGGGGNGAGPFSAAIRATAGKRGAVSAAGSFV